MKQRKQMLDWTYRKGPWTIKPRKSAKVKEPTETEELTADLGRAEAGEISYGDVREKYPLKYKEIAGARVGSLSSKSQNIIQQFRQFTKEADTQEDYDAIVKDLLGDLVERENEAKQKGIEVDQILDILGITRDEIKGLEKEEKKPSAWKNIIGFFTD